MGYLRRPYLHDGYVIGLHLVGKNLRITVKDTSKRTFVLELVGLDRLCCNEFTEGNIIHHIVIISKASLRPVRAANSWANSTLRSLSRIDGS